MPNPECDWCNREAVWTVTFDDCDHATGCCDEHYAEYFMGIGCEAYYEKPEDFEATCPACAG